MTEPIYNYVKGEGWVLTLENLITMACGTVVRLEYRRPVLGEYFDAGGPNYGTQEEPNKAALGTSDAYL
jgi:hypothetical protein